MSRTAVVAIGGNSLITDAEHRSVEDQYRAAGETDHHIAALIADGWNVAITHGNGPQIGFILRRSELARHELHEVPLDVCGADTQGAIGYALQQNLLNDFRRLGLDKSVVTVITQVEVDPADSAFGSPAKPIGSFLEQEEAFRRRDEEGWRVAEDAGRGWRRVVASPEPIRIVEIEAIRSLLASDYTVIGVGGGGLPVVRDEAGDLHGVAAVIDKDRASALLANELGADLLLISTAVEQVALDFGKPQQRWIDEMSLEEAKKYLNEGIHFAPGSMAPKIEAVIRYLEAGGGEALITNPENIERAMRGETGTRVTA